MSGTAVPGTQARMRHGNLPRSGVRRGRDADHSRSDAGDLREAKRADRETKREPRACPSLPQNSEGGAEHLPQEIRQQRSILRVERIGFQTLQNL